MPGGFVCSGTMKHALQPPAVKSALAGELAIRKLFSKEQREFFAAHAPDGVGFNDLSMLGPIFVLKSRFTPAELETFIAAMRSRLELLRASLAADEARIVRIVGETEPFRSELITALERVLACAEPLSPPVGVR